MKTNKNLKITKKGIEPLKNESDGIKGVKSHKDKSSKRRLSIYDDFNDEDEDDLNYNFNDENFEDEDED